MNEIKISESLSALKSIVLPGSKDVIVIMDVHGVIFESTWLNELKEFYIKATGDTDLDNILKWQEECTGKSEGVDAARVLSEKTDKEYSNILPLFLDIQEYHHNVVDPELKSGVTDFINAMNKDNIPLCLISGSAKARILRQLKQTGISQYFNDERIYGLDLPFRRKNFFKNDLIYEIHDDYPDKQLIYFDDWIAGLDSVKELGGIIFGMPIGDGNILKQSSEIMASFGADYLLYNWNNWKAIRDILLKKG